MSLATLTVLAANPVQGVSDKAVAIIATLAAVCVAWAALKIFARSSQGNVKKDMNVGGSVGIGLIVLAVALGLATYAAWVSGFLNYLI